MTGFVLSILNIKSDRLETGPGIEYPSHLHQYCLNQDNFRCIVIHATRRNVFRQWHLLTTNHYRTDRVKNRARNGISIVSPWIPTQSRHVFVYCYPCNELHLMASLTSNKNGPLPFVPVKNGARKCRSRSLFLSKLTSSTIFYQNCNNPNNTTTQRTLIQFWLYFQHCSHVIQI